MKLKQAEQYRQEKRAELEAAGNFTSDGCTLAPEIGTPCCEMHDYLRRFQPDGITPLQADNLLFACVWSKGSWRKPWYWLLAPVYWLGTAIPRRLGFYK